MTDLRDAAWDALNALLRVQPQVRGAIPVQDVEEAITALRAALAEPDHSPNCALLQVPSRDCDCRQEDAEPVARYSDIISDGGMDPRNKFDRPPARRVMLEYLQLMIARGDWHGVADAAMDLREMEAEAAGRKRVIRPDCLNCAEAICEACAGGKQ